MEAVIWFLLGILAVLLAGMWLTMLAGAVWRAHRPPPIRGAKGTPPLYYTPVSSWREEPEGGAEYEIVSAPRPPAPPAPRPVDPPIGTGGT